MVHTRSGRHEPDEGASEACSNSGAGFYSDKMNTDQRNPETLGCEVDNILHGLKTDLFFFFVLLFVSLLFGFYRLSLEFFVVVSLSGHSYVSFLFYFLPSLALFYVLAFS